MPYARVKTRAVVKWYDPRKGFGFATRKGAPEVFLHYGAIRTDGVITLKPGQMIECILEQTQRGAVAHEIEVLE
jgi:cold shock protein